MSSFSIGSSANASRVKASEAIPEGVIVRIVSAEVVENTRFPRTIQKGPRAGTTEPALELKVGLEYNGKAYFQYTKGVYRNSDGSLVFTEEGGSGIFVASLKNAGLPIGSSIESLVGLDFTTKHRTGGAGKMAFCHVVAAPKPAVAVKATAKVAVTPNAFDALSQADRDLLIDATKDGTTLLPQEVVEAGIAKDTTQANAILEGLAAHRTTAAPKLARK